MILPVVLLVLAGCSKPEAVLPATTVKKVNIPAGIAGTVSEYADMVGGEPLLVRGYGLVVGLGKNGSSEVPADVKAYLVRQMAKAGVGSAMAGTAGLTPEAMLADKDTAVVTVGGYLPPGAPAGTHFDLLVEALPNTQTASLDGGNLMTADLRIGLMTGAVDAKPLASGKGSVFVNPFIDSTLPTEQGKLRSGRILNGGMVTSDRPVRIQLRTPDYRMAQLIQRRLNDRFGPTDTVATAQSPSLVALKVPRSYARDYDHFLELVAHTYLIDAAGEIERHARQLASAILLPTAQHRDISLVWEAMGNQVLPAIRPLYASDNDIAAFFACRAGLRLGDALAGEPMMQLAAKKSSPMQLEAIAELGKARGLIKSVQVLRDCLAGDNDMVRIAAYEALLRRGDSALQSFSVGSEFTLDIIPGDQNHVIYATQAGQPRIALFGRTMPINRPAFYCPPDQLITLNANQQDPLVKVCRKIPRTGQSSEFLQIKPDTSELVRLLGSRAVVSEDGEIHGLGLTYSQVVGVLQNLSKQGQITAKFVLQQPPSMQRIYPFTTGLGRPDRPEDAPVSQ
jgi:flagellar basal body P-ring protein FlgI